MGCIHPITVKNPKGIGTLPAPCGACPGCRQQRAAAWAFRLQQEQKQHDKSIFVTLTYDEFHVKGSEYGLLTLDKRDLQTFFKRLRYYNPSGGIRYYACGEYGGQTRRPHYHAIIFSAYEDDVARAWQLGNTHFGEVNPRTISYVTKYLCKPRIGKSDDDDRQPEFALMSKGLGLNYLTDEMRAYHEKGSKSFVTLPGGLKQALPRYYRDKVFTEAQREEINEQAYKKQNEALKKAVQEAGSYTEYENRRRAAIAAAKEKFASQHYSTRKTL